jgi:hypothetical protein
VVTDWRSGARASIAGRKPSGGQSAAVSCWPSKGDRRWPAPQPSPSRTTKTSDSLRPSKGGPVTDVCDAAWLGELLEHGLLRGSFVPPPPIRELRDLTRYRKRLIQAHASEGQRVQKTLEDAGIKLDSVATDVLGVSGRAMLTALVAGEPDPSVLAELAKGRLRAKLPPRPAHPLGLGAPGAAGGLDRRARHPHRPGARPVHPGPGPAGHHHRGGQAGRRDNHRRDRHRHDGVPDRLPPGVVGRALSGQQPHRWQAPLGQAHQGQPLAGGGAHLGAPGRRRAAATATCRPSTGGSRAGLARRRPRSRSGTRSWSSPGTCSPTTATTRTWVATTSSGATPIASDNGPSSNSRPSATASSSNPLRRNTPRIHVSG